ncbi:ABC transporter family substrate-binding protein [Timonella sp. A28]|uniref:ABC transporter family substrate-binding protein n=1 Tax=Timonella sp. A28 TaxID=3442640 RepID=UPI003EB8DBF8
MKIKKWAPLAALVGATLALGACSTPASEDSPTTDQTNTGPKVVTVGWNQPFYSYNENTDHGNASANAVITTMTLSTFNYYDKDLNLVPDTSFGNYEIVSEDPLKIKYTLSENAKWSDGTPLDSADLLLAWAGLSSNLNDSVDTDEETGEVIVKEDQVFFASGSPGLALVKDVPEIGDDGKSVTLSYSKPFADWETAFAPTMPAHITAKFAGLGDDAAAGKKAVTEAIQNNDRKALAKIAEAWRTGFDFKATPAENQALASGPYIITEYTEGQSIILEKNENYVGDKAGKLDRIVVRYNEDPQAQVQALQNGEIDMLAPQATADTLTQLQALQNVEVATGVDGTYEHVDMVQNNGGPFDPATYGGDAEKAKKVRQAFLLTIPRQAIVEQLIMPINPNAKTRDSFLLLEDDPNYPAMVEQNGSAAFKDVDIEKAKSLLKEVGVDKVDVRLLFAKDNVRRANEYVLIQESAAKAGFNVIDSSNTEWGSMLATAQDKYDASLFGWQSTSTAVTESDATYRTKGLNNFYGYSNKTVDGLFKDLQVETEPAKQAQIQIDIEKQLWEDAFGTTIFQFPAVNAWNKKVSGVQPISISPTIFAGFWNWDITG